MKNKHVLAIDIQNHFIKGDTFNNETEAKKIIHSLLSELKNNTITKFSLVADELFLQETDGIDTYENFYETFGYLSEDKQDFVYGQLKEYFDLNIYNEFVKTIYSSEKEPENIIRKEYGYMRDVLDTNDDIFYLLVFLKLELDKLNIYSPDAEELSECKDRNVINVIELIFKKGFDDYEFLSDRLSTMGGLDYETISERYSVLNKDDDIILMGGDGCQCLMEEYITLNLLGFNVSIDENNIYTHDISQFHTFVSEVSEQKKLLENSFSIDKQLEIYKVGGCVRDKLLELEPKDIDYVVVGSTPEKMIDLGFKKVGANFEVYLHPETGDEYALARTEKSTGKSYTDFITEVKGVSLNDDLYRRDLTINSIALNSNGRFIDPYGGINDIKNKILRHTSEAFMDDPLRILRVARFNSRYPDFTVAEETVKLMKLMVSAGMIDHLTPERIWKETGRVLLENKPSLYFKTLEETGALDKILPEIKNDLNNKLNKLDKISTLKMDEEKKQLAMFCVLCHNIDLKDIQTISKRLGRFDTKILNALDTIIRKNFIETFVELKKDIKTKKLEKISHFFDGFKNKGFCDLDTLYVILKNTTDSKNCLALKELKKLFEDYKNTNVEGFIQEFEKNKGKKPEVSDIKDYILKKQIKNYSKTLKKNGMETQEI